MATTFDPFYPPIRNVEEMTMYLWLVEGELAAAFMNDGEHDAYYDIEHGISGSTLMDACGSISEDMFKDHLNNLQAENEDFTLYITDNDTAYTSINETGLSARDIQTAALLWATKQAVGYKPEEVYMVLSEILDEANA